MEVKNQFSYVDHNITEFNGSNYLYYIKQMIIGRAFPRSLITDEILPSYQNKDVRITAIDIRADKPFSALFNNKTSLESIQQGGQYIIQYEGVISNIRLTSHEEAINAPYIWTEWEETSLCSGLAEVVAYRGDKEIQIEKIGNEGFEFVPIYTMGRKTYYEFSKTQKYVGIIYDEVSDETLEIPFIYKGESKVVLRVPTGE